MKNNIYKIDVKEVFKKQITVSEKNPEKALDFVKNMYMKSDLLDFKAEDLYEVSAKIIEENGNIIEENMDDYAEEYSEEK